MLLLLRESLDAPMRTVRTNSSPVKTEYTKMTGCAHTPPLFNDVVHVSFKLAAAPTRPAIKNITETSVMSSSRGALLQNMEHKAASQPSNTVSGGRACSPSHFSQSDLLASDTRATENVSENGLSQYGYGGLTWCCLWALLASWPIMRQSGEFHGPFIKYLRRSMSLVA